MTIHSNKREFSTIVASVNHVVEVE